MSDIDEFKGKLRGEVEAAQQRVQAMQAETAEQFRQLQGRYKTFLEVSSASGTPSGPGSRRSARPCQMSHRS